MARLSWLVIVLLLAGCSKDGSNLLPVEGTVTLGDKALATDAHTTGTVILHPDKSKGNESLEEPRGVIDSAGKFKILTGMKPGAAPLCWWMPRTFETTVARAAPATPPSGKPSRPKIQR